MIRTANAPCSWGVIENIDGERYDYARVLDEIAATGYTATELGDWGFLPTEPDALRDALARRRLALLASWVSVHLHDPARHASSAEACVRTARLLAAVGGSSCLIVLGNDPYGQPVRSDIAGRVTPAAAMTDAQWDIFVAGAHHVARRVREATGLRTVFHHHVGTWIETPAETDRLLAMTDPALLGLAFDTGHWKFGNGPVEIVNEVDAVRQYADRIWHVHFKDHDPHVAARSRIEGWSGPRSVGEGIFCELGKGNVDFPGVLAALREAGYAGSIVVEQDVLPGLGTPAASAARNRAYLHSIGL